MALNRQALDYPAAGAEPGAEATGCLGMKDSTINTLAPLLDVLRSYEALREVRTLISEFVTERFPDGLTVLHGRGQFLNSQGDVERERSVVLILLYPVNARNDKSAKIEEIRDEYKKRFQQQSVLRVDDPLPVWVSF